MALRRAPDSVGCSDEDGVAWRAKFISRRWTGISTRCPFPNSLEASVSRKNPFTLRSGRRSARIRSVGQHLCRQRVFLTGNCTDAGH